MKNSVIFVCVVYSKSLVCIANKIIRQFEFYFLLSFFFMLILIMNVKKTVSLLFLLDSIGQHLLKSTANTIINHIDIFFAVYPTLL